MPNYEPPTAWDLALRKYQKRSNVSTPITTPSHIPDTDADPNNRLYLEHFERRKRMDHLRQERHAQETFEKNLIFQSFESCPVEAETFERKLREHRDLIGQEHETYGKMQAEVAELEEERLALKNVCATRVNADPVGPQGHFDVNLRRSLLSLGDAKRNDGAVERLLRSQSLGSLRRFVEEAQKIKHEQQKILTEFDQLVHHQQEVEGLMAQDIAKRLGRRTEDLLNRLSFSEALEKALADLLCEDLEEEVRRQRREFLIETNYLGISLLKALIQNDIDWLNLLSRFRLAKFHLRGYNPTAVEDLKDAPWYRDLGPSSSLRNSARIRQSAQSILKQACDMVKGERSAPNNFTQAYFADYASSARYFVV